MGEQLLPGGFPSFRHLRVFEAVASYQNLSRAAVEANLSQPAVTQAIMKIEDWVGVKLFQRSWTGTFLTREGRIFFARVQRLFEQVEAALRQDLFPDSPKDVVQTVMGRLKGSHINVLAAVSESVSFEDAALSLDVSRTAVQRTAREIEHILGRSLYERTSGGLVANAAARRLATALPRACRELPEVVEEIAALAGTMKSRLFIGTQRLVCSSLLASAINGVLSVYPDTQVKIIEGSYRHLLNELRSGRIDLMFSAMRRPEGAADVVEEPLFNEPYCVACRRGHPLLSKPNITLNDLARLSWVLPGGDSQRKRAYDDLFRNTDDRPASCITAAALTTQISILTSTDCVTLLPRFELRLEEFSSGLAVLSFQPRVARSSEGLTMRTDWVPNPVQSYFRDQLRHRIRTLGLSLRPSARRITAETTLQPGLAGGGAVPEMHGASVPT